MRHDRLWAWFQNALNGSPTWKKPGWFVNTVNQVHYAPWRRCLTKLHNLLPYAFQTLLHKAFLGIINLKYFDLIWVKSDPRWRISARDPSAQRKKKKKTLNCQHLHLNRSKTHNRRCLRVATSRHKQTGNGEAKWNQLFQMAALTRLWGGTELVRRGGCAGGGASV